MARPPKNYCDYFPHDAGMRNHKKVKALRSKFGTAIGYTVWSMILEYLTGSDGNVFPYTEMEFELMSGDFGVSATEIRSVVDYCVTMEMLFNENGFIKSESLDERLAPVYEKRNKSKGLSKQQQRTNGKFASNNTESNGQSVAEMPQTKVNGIKVNKKKENDTITSKVAIAPGYGFTDRKLKFKKEVFEVGGLIYTQKMITKFCNHWSEANKAKIPKMRFEKETTWETPLRLRTWADRNLDKIVCYLTDGEKTIKQKQQALAQAMESFKEKHTSETLNAFYRYWSMPENKPEPQFIRWELEEFWDLGQRLSSWKSSPLNKGKEEEKVLYQIPK